ncbi:Oxidative stress genes repressor [Anaerohalosphaera lusitana]|uniref:Oxidative stress genes repressor n=1 Tax=Anaerohalosphaera lusitana TaxID=1936003 RepID=A0A1U9NNN0_9BACT|nr:Fur family transcriptional regulator [Anaerohalosphaera lusitana]AQT69499.1 Oxidative stress genes repressor [Anaerohalosphaera lusitana]
MAETKFEQLCRDKGLRLTPQRAAIYRILAGSKEHPSAESVWREVRKEMPRVSLDTVNRTLLTFAEAGLAFVVAGSGGAKRFDANLDSHQHFKCVKCNEIVDFHHEPFDDILVPPELPSGFRVLRATVYLEGLCDNCKENN